MPDEEKPKKAKSKREGKKAPWTFPQKSLEEAIQIPKVIDEKNAGNPMPAQTLAMAVGFRLAQDWRFQDLLKAANLYGLVNGSGPKAVVSITKLGQDIVAPSAPSQRSEGLLAAFRSVKDFENVEKFYGGKRIPEDEFFLNTVIREFNIPRDRVEVFAKVFRDNLNFLRSFSGTSAAASEPIVTIPTSAQGTPAEKLGPVVSKEPRVREFLDTCFVMMPFGYWFDRYYKEIYVPAIKEAGFEPVRADELFTTGSVVEQVWEQIEKAKLLLADLSGKNANVFYELGLAHAARKPVVFTSAQLDDVPFDLRHLRVIIYDIREPEWSPRLTKSVTDYLRNAMKEPGKSIPHPFRKLAEEAEGSISAKGTRRG